MTVGICGSKLTFTSMQESPPPSPPLPSPAPPNPRSGLLQRPSLVHSRPSSHWPCWPCTQAAVHLSSDPQWSPASQSAVEVHGVPHFPGSVFSQTFLPVQSEPVQSPL